jgi:hypothetical protein
MIFYLIYAYCHKKHIFLKKYKKFYTNIHKATLNNICEYILASTYKNISFHFLD